MKTLQEKNPAPRQQAQFGKFIQTRKGYIRIRYLYQAPGKPLYMNEIAVDASAQQYETFDYTVRQALLRQLRQLRWAVSQLLDSRTKSV